MLLCLILMVAHVAHVVHVVHVRKLKAQLVKEEKEASKIKSPSTINLHTVINSKNDKELPQALKVYLDDKLYKQPRLTHHQKSQILKKLSPKLCSLIARYFDSFYGRREQVHSSFEFQPLGDDFYLSLKAGIKEFNASIKKNPLSKLPLSERYIY